MDESSPNRDTVVTQLERVLSSSLFRKAERSSALLRFIVNQTLDGSADRLKEYTLGAEALGRGESFDPRTDPVVRAEACRLRARLDQYYATAGLNDPVVIGLTKGSYVPQFLARRDLGVTDPELVAARTSTSFRVAKNPVVAWTCAAVAVMISAVGWLQVRSAPVRQPRPAQFEVELTSEGVLASDVGTTVVLSTDGTRMVFVSRDP